MTIKQPGLVACVLFFVAGAAFFVAGAQGGRPANWALGGVFVALGALYLVLWRSGRF